ncbi:L-dopachrome tautomerase-related protein [Cytobacillus oceanisediminis]|uniref:Gluconolaconase n=1 Tax=Cytobacillus oceanisediminis 2691 TaxID=1196031 RepID=A0A160MCB0_9BACI|nr:L-dopachrome tautomerase-related protein [Cytobacillus oceanisediminis]AND40550.1 gluconolaconase [Cytobacillus oceanisediminis 2691]MCM3401022.1 gluconolaconase [Cytobacillus oceanisediminis]MDK7665316.1 L-dopachrome tautomerase-related protein [Cytobacillus oceanisediminis]
MKPMLPMEKYFGKLELVYVFYGAMPTGVSVSETGRIFICFPKWGDDVKFTVAEIVGDTLQPYPSLETNFGNQGNITMSFISVQSVVADGRGTLWVLDTAAPNFSVPIKGGAKLVAIDLKTNTIRKVYTFTEDVVLPTTYLNDVRFDFRVGKAGYAYITDSSSKGPGAIIVVDLANGNAFRRLNGANSTSPDPYFLPKVEGKILMNRNKDGSTSPFRLASDGIAISPDGKILFFCPLTSRHLFSISTEALRDRTIPDMDLFYQVEYRGEKGASDGMITGAKGTIYAGDYENNSIRKILQNGIMETIAHDPRILWPDTFSIGPDQYLYVIVNQLHRQARFHYGKDLRQKPYSLLRMKIDEFPAPTFS